MTDLLYCSLIQTVLIKEKLCESTVSFDTRSLRVAKQTVSRRTIVFPCHKQRKQRLFPHLPQRPSFLFHRAQCKLLLPERTDISCEVSAYERDFRLVRKEEFTTKRPSYLHPLPPTPKAEKKKKKKQNKTEQGMSKFRLFGIFGPFSLTSIFSLSFFLLSIRAFVSNTQKTLRGPFKKRRESLSCSYFKITKLII